MRGSNWAGLFIVACLMAPVGARAGTCTLAGLGWMAANWSNSAEPDRAQERWAAAPDHVLMGSSFEFPAGKGGYAEAMTIRTEGDDIIMVLRHFDGGLKRAWEERDAPMVFKAATCGASSAMFDGQGDHAGEHLTYERSGRNLHIIGDFIHHGTPQRVEWRMVKTGD